ncbi:MAG: hypothetical protein ACLRL3_00520 [Bifidobacterium adolescentis]
MTFGSVFHPPTLREGVGFLAGPVFEDRVELAHHGLVDGFVREVEDPVERAEMVHGFRRVVQPYLVVGVFGQQRAGVEQLGGLFRGQRDPSMWLLL